MATIRDVAKKANVSISTVSRVLNGHKMISDETRQKVLKTVEELNYTPKPRGRASHKSNRKSLLVLTPSPVPQITNGIFEGARDHGYDAMITIAQSNNDGAYVKYVEEGLFSGIVLLNIRLSSNISEFLLSKCPIVQCNEYDVFPKANLVTIDNSGATRDITNHLIETGKRRLAFISPQYIYGYQVKFALDREYGFRRALEESNIDLNPEFIVRTDFELGIENYREYVEKIHSIVRNLLSYPEDERPNGIVCSNDQIAASCINAAKAMGLRIPEDLAVTTFDNTFTCFMTDPFITSIKQPNFELGYESANLLVSVINEKPTVSKQVLLGHSIIKRGSSVITK